MPTFVTPYSGSAELTANTGLTVVDAGLWRYSQAGYNDGATFGLSLGHPNPLSGGLLLTLIPTLVKHIRQLLVELPWPDLGQ
jgi:hypothetical protein